MIRKTLLSIYALALLLFAVPALAAVPVARWSGTVARIAGDDLALAGVPDRFRLAGGVTELMTGRTLSSKDLAPGTAVTLRLGPREPDGRLRVDHVLVQPQNPLTLQGQVTGVAADGRTLWVLGVRVALDGHTAFSGRGATGPVRAARDVSTGMTAEVTLTAKAGGVLQADHVRVSGLRSRSTRTLSGRASRRGDEEEFKGTVVAITDTTWTIDAREITVDDRTVFIGDPGVGDFVEVRVRRDADGNAFADRIQKEDAADDELEFRGIVEAIGETSWTISGRVVLVNASTLIRDNPKVGDLVEVRADRAPDGTLTATKIDKEDEDAEDEQEFTGHVVAIGDASWTIDDTVVLVNASTEIRDDPQVGDLVEVRADRAADGTLTATRIKKEDGDDHGGPGHGGGDNSGESTP